MTTRYSFGGDEHLFVEMDEQMSLEAFFKALSLCAAVRESHIEGVTEVCPGNASMQVRFDPDVIEPEALKARVQALEAGAAEGKRTLETRLIEMPVYYDDPWTRETMSRFPERRQDPAATDLEYAARINGEKAVAEFIEAHSSAPWFVSMVGFVSGCPFLYQMVERSSQIEAPKYVRPRTDTPKLTIGHGGCFSAIYPVRGAGGYQMFGISPMPIYDPSQTVSYLRDFMILFNPGDILKFKPVDRQEYDALLKQVEENTFTPAQHPVSFSLDDFQADPKAYTQQLLGVLHAH